LVTPQFKLSPDAMIYARVASGYRIGGPNVTAAAGSSIPEDYKPDTTINYELGIKDELADRRLSIDAAIYYIKWHNFQLNVCNPGGPGGGLLCFETNAGDAKSEGVELSVQSHPITGLTLGAQGSFNEAELTQNLPPAAVTAGIYGLAGDPLPYSIRWSGGVTATQEFPLSGEWKGFVGGQYSYVGARPTEFASSATSVRAELGSYTSLNLRVGARTDAWLLNLYVNNVADLRSVIGATPYVSATGIAGGFGYYGSVIQPRTIGISVSRRF
jgi:outer membrane receptor protein involved in Fe transport